MILFEFLLHYYSYFVSGMEIIKIIIKKTKKEVPVISDFDDGSGIKVIKERKDPAPYWQDITTTVIIENPALFPIEVWVYDFWEQNRIRFTLYIDENSVVQREYHNL